MFQKLFIKDKFFWISYIITILACYGFTLTNYSIGVDDESIWSYVYDGSFIIQGRPGEPLLSHIFDIYYFLPFWHDFLALIIFSLSILIWIYLFKKVSNNAFDDKQSTIFACVSVSFPLIAKSFIFMISTIGFGLCLLLSGIALLFFSSAILKNSSRFKNLFLAGLISTSALLIGENSAVILVSGFFIILFLQVNTCEIRKNFIEYGIIFIKFLFLMIISLFFRKIISNVVADIYHLQLVKYVDSYILYDFQSILTSIATAFRNIINHFLIFSTNDINIIIYRISVISVCLFATIQFIKKRNLYNLLFALGLILSPLSLCFITGNVFLPERTLAIISYFAGFGISLLHAVFKDAKLGKIVPKYLVYFLVFYLVLYQSKEMNVTFYTDYLNYKLDEQKMNTIMHDLQKESNGNINKSVIFIGIP